MLRTNPFWFFTTVFFLLAALWGGGQAAGLVPSLPDVTLSKLFSNPPTYSDMLVSASLERFEAQGDADVYGFMKAYDDSEVEKPMRAVEALRAIDGSGITREAYPYISNFGLPYEIGKMLISLGFSAKSAIIILTLGNAAVSALLVAAIAVWAQREFSFGVGLAIFLACAASPLFLERAASLYWGNALVFAPFVLSLYAFPHLKGAGSWGLYLSGIAALFFVKCLMGYEFLTNIALGAALPAAYYIIRTRGRLGWGSFCLIIAAGTVIVLAGIAGFAGAVLAHAAKLSVMFDGDFARGLDTALAPAAYSVTGDGAGLRSEPVSVYSVIKSLAIAFVASNFVLNVLLWGSATWALVRLLRKMACSNLGWAQLPVDIRSLALMLPFVFLAWSSWYLFAFRHAMAHPHVIWFTLILNVVPFVVPLIIRTFTWTSRDVARDMVTSAQQA